MQMFNRHGRGASFSSVKDTVYELLCAIIEFAADHKRRAMSRDHCINSVWFSVGGNI